jgi:hypothetical protein
MSDLAQMSGAKGTTPRTAAIVTAVSLLVMAIVAGVANFAAVEGLRVADSPAATAANLVRSAGVFRLGAVGLLLAAVLDVVVAWGVYLTFGGVNRGLALLGGWFRLAYAAVFAVVINNLFMALGAATTDPAQMQFLLEAFDSGWMLGQVLFGIHLVLVGVLVWPGKIFSRIVSVLLFVAGAGYLVDGVATMLSPTYSLTLSVYTFVGEVVLIIWLFVRGGREAA